MTLESFLDKERRGVVGDGDCFAAAVDAVSQTHELDFDTYYEFRRERERQKGFIEPQVVRTLQARNKVYKVAGSSLEFITLEVILGIHLGEIFFFETRFGSSVKCVS